MPINKNKIAKLKKRLSKTRSKKTRKKIQAKISLEKIPKTNTKPELKTKAALEQLGVLYVQQYYLSGYYFDFYLPEHNILIETNGDFFHSNPLVYKTRKTYTQIKNYRRDRRKLVAALNHGKKVIYAWEKDLNERSRALKNELRRILIDNENDFKSRHLLEDVFTQYKNFYRIRGS